MFAVGAYPCGAPFSFSPPRKTPGLIRKHSIRLKRPARDKHSSLLQTLINYGCIKLHKVVSWNLLYKTFLRLIYQVVMYASNGTTHLKKCKQLFEYQHLLLLKRHLVVKVIFYI